MSIWLNSLSRPKHTPGWRSCQPRLQRSLVSLLELNEHLHGYTIIIIVGLLMSHHNITVSQWVIQALCLTAYLSWDK